MKNDDSIPFPRLASELFAAFGQHGPGYDGAYKAACAGLFPVEYRKRNIFVRRKDLPLIAEALGIDTSARRAA